MAESSTSPKDLRALVDKGRRAKWWRRTGKSSKTFKYTDHAGKPITKKGQLERIQALVIPPAWNHVRISPAMGGSLQAVGVDADGRIQYLYHEKFAAKRQRQKFAKLERFGKALPQLREVIAADLRRNGLPREKVLAVMLKLINKLYFRVGTDQSAERYRTYGITTLKNGHVKFGRGGEVVFEFVGKSHIHQRTVLVDKKMSGLIKQISEIGAKKKLFNYLDENERTRPLKPADINAYLKAAMGTEFSAKDLRTWGASLLAAVEFAGCEKCDDEKEMKDNIIRVIDTVAEGLGNTRAVCRAAYIHPAIISAYEKGVVIKRPSAKVSSNGFEPGERELIKLLRDLGG